MALFNSNAPVANAPAAGGIEAAMGIARTAGASNAVTRAAIKEAYKDAPKSEFWANIGYSVEVTFNDGTSEIVFISLVKGVALDGLENLPVNSSNERYARINDAKNGLLQQLLGAGRKLKPGTARVLPQLQVELRRNGTQAEGVKENAYKLDLNLDSDVVEEEATTA